MQEQEKRGAYRPAKRLEPVKRLTLEISQDDWDYITRVSSNRTQWIIQAIKIQREHEEADKARFHNHTTEEIQALVQQECEATQSSHRGALEKGESHV